MRPIKTGPKPIDVQHPAPLQLTHTTNSKNSSARPLSFLVGSFHPVRLLLLACPAAPARQAAYLILNQHNLSGVMCTLAACHEAYTMLMTNAWKVCNGRAVPCLALYDRRMAIKAVVLEPGGVLDPANQQQQQQPQQQRLQQSVLLDARHSLNVDCDKSMLLR